MCQLKLVFLGEIGIVVRCCGYSAGLDISIIRVLRTKLHKPEEMPSYTGR